MEGELEAKENKLERLIKKEEKYISAHDYLNFWRM
jgi:hypothetical protein